MRDADVAEIARQRLGPDRVDVDLAALQRKYQRLRFTRPPDREPHERPGRTAHPADRFLELVGRDGLVVHGQHDVAGPHPGARGG